MSVFAIDPPLVGPAAILDELTQGRALATIQRGKATLGGGTATVTGVTLTANSRIFLTRNTPAGSAGDLSAPDASRNTSTGQFVINSASGSDTSTVDFEIIG